MSSKNIAAGLKPALAAARPQACHCASSDWPHCGPEIHISTAFESTQCGATTERAVAPAATSARAFWLILSLQAQLEPIRQARD
jgi:hypothetical protein